MVELELDRIEKGTLYFRKAIKRNMEFKALVIEVEACVDKNNRSFTAAQLLPDGVEKKERWNCFNLIEAKKIRIGKRILAQGVYFGPFKKELKVIEVLKNRRNKK